MDAPYNLLPSLHAAFTLILLNSFFRHTRGFIRVVTMIWFVLIALSPVLTYQHHVIDIVGGFVLAGYCFYLFREPTLAPPIIVNRRIGSYYRSGSGGCLDCGSDLLAMGSSASLASDRSRHRGERVLQSGSDRFFARLKENCRGARGLCWRLTYSVNICRCCITGGNVDRGTRSHHKSGLGGKLGCRSANKALCSGVVSVLDLSAEFSEAKPFRKINYRNTPVLDLTAPSQAQLVEISKFIGNHSRNGAVYVHCKIGYSRSAAAVTAYLIMSGKVKTAEEAFAMIRRVRPSVVIRPEVRSALSEFEHRVRSSPGGTGSFVLALDHGALS